MQNKLSVSLSSLVQSQPKNMFWIVTDLITFSSANKVHGRRSYESPLLLLGRLTVTAAVATTRVAVVMVASCMLLLMLMMVVLLSCPCSSPSLPILLLLLFLRLHVRLLGHVRVKRVGTERFISSFRAQKFKWNIDPFKMFCFLIKVRCCT